MDTKTLERLRPADDTAAAIRTSLTAIADHRRGAEKHLATLRARRSHELLNSPAKQVAATELEAREVEIEIEQLDLLTSALKSALDKARAAEIFARLQLQANHVVAEINHVNRWLNEDYPKLAAQIADGLRRYQAAQIALDGLRVITERDYRDSNVAAHGRLLEAFPML